MNALDIPHLFLHSMGTDGCNGECLPTKEAPLCPHRVFAMAGAVGGQPFTFPIPAAFQCQHCPRHCRSLLRLHYSYPQCFPPAVGI